MTSKDKSPALALFAGALFLSAALMFALQPMVGKMLLPLVGGTPAGWIVTMAFFQIMLLAGYFVAHFLSRFSPRVHGILYVLLLCIGCLFLPVGFAGDADATPGAVDVFMLLARSVAMPFIAISATASTLQRLFATTGHAAGKDPYFLYAASNLGSFTGLFLYPLVFEPLWGNAAQARYWYAAFAVLIAAAIICVAGSGKTAEGKAAASEDDAPVDMRRKLEWLALSFLPSALLLAVTTHISTDVFSAPMIWVVPLAIYLLTFVIAFARKPLVQFKDAARWHHIAVPVAVALLCVTNLNLRVTIYAMFFHLLAFGATALACHLRLASLRPAGTGRNLTGYYLTMSLGGALGGALNAFVLPVVLDRLIEYPVFLILSLLLMPAFREKMKLVPKMMLGMAGFAGVMYTAMVFYVSADSSSDIAQYNSDVSMTDFMLFTIALLVGMNVRTAFYGAAVMLALYELVLPRNVMLTTRNFYGVIKVFERPIAMADGVHMARYMYHGTTTHGIQITDKANETRTTAYFWGGGPVSDVFALYNPKDIAVIGLGAGTMNCYSTPDRAFTFFEIDPEVKRVAEEEFTFLKACTGRRPPRIIIGDGRIELNRQADEKYNLIALDAFSSDTIPTHLLTLEAVEGYLKRLAPGGILMFNLSNRYFTLANPLLRIAEELGLKTRFVLDVPPPDATHAAASIWFVMAQQDTSLSPLEDYGWVELQAPPGTPLWTDDHTQMLSVLSFTPSAVPPRGQKQ